MKKQWMHTSDVDDLLFHLLQAVSCNYPAKETKAQS